MPRLRNESYDLCSEVLDAVGEHVALIDSHGVIVSVNAAWTRFSAENGGVRSGTGVGRNYLEICEQAGRQGIVEANLLKRELEAALRGASRGGVAGGVEIPYPCHSPRELRWFSARVVGISKNGKSYAAVLHSNTTMRTLLRERLLRLTEDLQQARWEGLLHEWTSYLAHELKTPLTAISLRAQFLKRLLVREKLRGAALLESCDAILSATSSAVALLESTRATRVYERQLPEDVPMRDLLEDLLSVARSESALSGSRIELYPVEESLVARGHPLRLMLAALGVLHCLVRSGAELIRIEAEASEDFVSIRFTASRAEAKPDLAASDPEFRLAEKLARFELGRIDRESRGREAEILFSIPYALTRADRASA